jgi:hypothetical protein
MSKSKDIPKTEDIKEEIKSMQRKWYENKIFFICSLVLWPPFFFGALRIGDWRFIPFGTTIKESMLAVTQTLMFLIAAGFFVLLLSYLFNQLWLLTLSGPKKEE